MSSLLEMLDSCERKWLELERALSSMPRCLVHGDFVGKNVLIETSADRTVTWIMDWDISGIGAPAFDIERLDAERYYRHCRQEWPDMTIESVASMSVVGSILRNVGLIAASTTSLGNEWLGREMEDLTTYGDALKRALGSFRPLR